ncbi:hypothetical protein [Intestinibacter sp.]|uniref:hypothetical protein n=1 Tax=Intestinibacter sp. TaxID=1965304 RepID=UPI003F168C6D
MVKRGQIKEDPESHTFRTEEECWEEIKKHEPFGWVITKDSKHPRHICAIYTTKEDLVLRFSDMPNKDFCVWLVEEHCTFLDGSPFRVNV